MLAGGVAFEVVREYEELGSYRAVGALMGCDHKTVKRYVEAAGDAGQLAPALTRSRVTDDFAGLICERVEQTHGRVTARRLMRIVRAAGYEGSERSLQEKLTVRKRDQPSTPEKNDSFRGPAAVSTVPAAPQSHSIHSPGSDTHGRKTRPPSACLARHAAFASATARRSERSEPS